MMRCDPKTKNVNNKIDKTTFIINFFTNHPCLIIPYWWWHIDNMIIDIILHKIYPPLAHQFLDLILKFLAILHSSSGLFCLENNVLGQWTNYAFSLAARVSWNGKHPWSKPFLNRSMSMSSVLKLKNVTLGKYLPISITLTLQKAKDLRGVLSLLKPLCLLNASCMIFIPDHALDKETREKVSSLAVQLCEKRLIG